MFNYLSIKERAILLIFPLAMVLVILFQGWQANRWRAEAEKEEQLKIQWANQFRDLASSIKRFDEQQQALHAKIDHLQESHYEQSKELHNALQHHPDWANEPVPDDIKRLFQRPHAH